jgi:hypothetical protein
MKKKTAQAASLDQDIRHEMRTLRQAARSAKKLADVTGTPFIVVKNGRLVDLNKGRKQSAKQKELVKLLRPFGA